MARGTDNQFSRRVNPGFRPKPLFDTRTNANPTGSTTMGSAGMSALGGVQGTPMRLPFPSRSPRSPDYGTWSMVRGETKRPGIGAVRVNPFGVAYPGRDAIRGDGVPSTVITPDTEEGSIDRLPKGSVVRLGELESQGKGMRGAAGGIRRQGAAANAEYKERAAAREQQAVEDSIARAGEYTDARQGQIDQLKREIARSEAAESMFRSEAGTQRDRNERARTMMNLSPAQQASVIANQDYDRQYGRRLAGLQGLGQRRAAEAAAGQAPTLTPEQEEERLFAYRSMGQTHPLMDTTISQFGKSDRVMIDDMGQENAEELMRRGDYLNINKDLQLQSIFSPEQRQEIKEERDIKHGLKRRVTEEEAAEDPSLKVGSIIDTDYAKSIDRQRSLGQRTGRLTEQARQILASADVSTAGLRGRNKIAEAWKEYDENTRGAEGKQAPAEQDPPSLFVKDGPNAGQLDPYAAQQRLAAWRKPGPARTEKGKRYRAIAKQITHNPGVEMGIPQQNIADMDAGTLVEHFVTNMKNPTQQQFAVFHDIARLHHVEDKGKDDAKKWDSFLGYGARDWASEPGFFSLSPDAESESFFGEAILRYKENEILGLLKEIGSIPENDTEALNEARRKWTELINTEVPSEFQDELRNRDMPMRAA